MFLNMLFVIYRLSYLFAVVLIVWSCPSWGPLIMYLRNDQNLSVILGLSEKQHLFKSEYQYSLSDLC